jgi:hypothetical protein
MHFTITGQEAMDIYRRKSSPIEYEIKQIETFTENRIMASGSEIEITKQSQEAEQRQRLKTDEKKMRIINKIEEFKNHARTTTSILTSISIPRIDKEEVAEKLIYSAGKVKKILFSGTTIAKEKIKEVIDVAEKRKTEIDTKRISKMGDLPSQFSSSFHGIVKISSTRIDTGQEQIYKGFTRLIGLKHKIHVAKKSCQVKNSVKKVIKHQNEIAHIDTGKEKITLQSYFQSLGHSSDYHSSLLSNKEYEMAKQAGR